MRATEKVLAVSEFAITDLAAAYRIPRPAAVANDVERVRFHPA